MQTYPTISVIIPAYDEARRLEATLRATVVYFRTRQRAVEVIVVDDGSRDGTGALVQRLSADFTEIRLIRLPVNRGKGHAVRTGIANASGAHILFMDADGAFPIAEIERLETALGAGADAAIGSRFLPSEHGMIGVRWYRRLIGRVFHQLVELLAVRGYHDTQCGFKLFNAAVAHDLFSCTQINGFSFDVELLLLARYRRYRISEVPVSWAHKPGSRVNLPLDSWRMLRELLVIRARLVRGDYAASHLAPPARTIPAQTDPLPRSPVTT